MSLVSFPNFLVLASICIIVCKSIRETNEPKQGPTVAAEELEKETTVEPPESDHPKCADLVFANGRWSLTRTEPQEVSLRRKLDTSTLRYNLLHAISKLTICAVPCCCCSYHKRSKKLFRSSLTRG